LPGLAGKSIFVLQPNDCRRTDGRIREENCMASVNARRVTKSIPPPGQYWVPRLVVRRVIHDRASGQGPGMDGGDRGSGDGRLAEAALLAGSLPRPRAWSPCDDPVRAREACGSVLDNLLEHGHLTHDEFRRAVDVPVATCSSDGSPRTHVR
jgi:hypothetical protein